MIQFIVGLLAAVLVIGLGVFGAKKLLSGLNGGEDPGKESRVAAESSSAAQETTEPETELRRAVLINDVDITGMSREEARTAVTKRYAWGMKAELETPAEGDEPYEIGNLLNLKLERILNEIYDTTASKDSYTLNAEGLDEEIAQEARAMAEKWNRKPKNGAVSGFDKATSAFSYSDSVDGRTVQEEQAVKDIATAMNEQNYGSTIKIRADVQPAELNAAQAKEKYKVIGTFTTKATANADRNNNLKLACEAIDGKILQVGEEFSFNKTTGNRTLERGYKPAGAYQNGKVVLEAGGGVCQVSSTLYNAVIRAGLTPTERHGHTFEPSYVTPGEDATVSYDGYAGPDMRFVNTTSSAIAIRASFYDRTVTASIVGLPILEEGVSISLKSVKTGEFDNGGVEYVEDTTLQPGIENIISAGSMGSRWVTNLVTKKDGEVISDVFFHNSTYKGHAKTIARNTSGIVTLPEGAEALTIVENTETVPEQAGDSATEAGNVIMLGPGESVSAGGPGSSTSTTVSPGPGPGSTETTHQASPETTHQASPETSHQASPETTAASPSPVEPSPTAAEPSPVAPSPTEAEVPAAPVQPGPGAAATTEQAQEPGGSLETVAPFPGA